MSPHHPIIDPFNEPRKKRKTMLIGMVHIGALPGTPYHKQPLSAIVQQTIEETQLLIEAGFDGIIIENMHDRPYLRRNVGPEIVSAMTRVGTAVQEILTECGKPFGVQILAGANREALAVTQAVGGQFIRAEGFVFSSIADEGLLEEADAGPLLRYRKMIGADRDIAIWADIKKKHSSHAITNDVDVAETARAAQFFGADAVIVTGQATGMETEIEEVAAVREAVDIPVYVGSGVEPESVKALSQYADGLIVGSWYKRDGQWFNEPDPDRVKQIVQVVRG